MLLQVSSSRKNKYTAGVEKRRYTCMRTRSIKYAVTSKPRHRTVEIAVIAFTHL